MCASVLDKPQVLRTQARAILRATDPWRKLYAMFLMIATVGDWRQVKGGSGTRSATSGITDPVSVAGS